MLDRDEQGVVLMTAEEVAAALKLASVRSVYKLAKLHEWTFARTISHRCVRYERRGLLRWIRSRPKNGAQAKPLDTVSE